MTGTEERTKLARLLANVAVDADRRGLPWTGVLRQSARVLLEPVADLDANGEVCAGCHRPLEQPPTGRRRKWCSEACRRRTRR